MLGTAWRWWGQRMSAAFIPELRGSRMQTRCHCWSCSEGRWERGLPGSSTVLQWSKCGVKAVPSEPREAHSDAAWGSGMHPQVGGVSDRGRGSIGMGSIEV